MRLALGTAQFGFAYGSAGRNRRNPQVDLAEAARIVRYAEQVGIGLLDTAVAYGDSERVLGTIGLAGWQVVTKLPPPPPECIDLSSWMLRQVDESARRLGVDRIYGVLLHDTTLAAGADGPRYARGLAALKESGLVSKVGYSIYSPKILDSMVSICWPDLVQTPYNVFDTRISSSGWLRRLTEGGTEVHARSSFLQGVLLMASADRPPYFERWKDAFRLWDMHVASVGASPVRAALGAVLAQPLMHRVVVGVHSVSHLKEIIAAVDDPLALPPWEHPVDDPKLVDPFRWEM